MQIKTDLNTTENEYVIKNQPVPKIIKSILNFYCCASITACNSGSENLTKNVQYNSSHATNQHLNVSRLLSHVEDKKKRREEQYKELKQDILHPDIQSSHDLQKDVDPVLDDVHSEVWASFYGRDGKIIMLDADINLADHLREQTVELPDNVLDISGNRVSLSQHNVFIHNNRTADNKPEIYVKAGSLYDIEAQKNILFAIYYDFIKSNRDIHNLVRFNDEFIEILESVGSDSDFIYDEYLKNLDQLKMVIKNGEKIDINNKRINEELQQLQARLLAYKDIYDKNNDTTLTDTWSEMDLYLNKEIISKYKGSNITDDKLTDKEKVAIRFTHGLLMNKIENSPSAMSGKLILNDKIDIATVLAIHHMGNIYQRLLASLFGYQFQTILGNTG